MTQAKKPPSRARPAGASRLAITLRRTALGLLTVGALSTQITSCGALPPWASLAALPTLASLQSLLASLPASFSLPPLAWPSALPQVVRPTATAYPFAECPQHFAGGIAPAMAQAAQRRELCYDAFAVLHHGGSRTPIFVAERINQQSVEDAKGEQRTNKFFADARLPRSERAELSDYQGSGYARGHMAPAGNMPNPTAMAQSFSLANMVPQNQRQNSGPWSKIEQDTRRYAARAQGDVFVITGPVFDAQSTTVGPNQVRVPSYLFKLVYDATTHKAWAHWQPNTQDARVGPPISYQELEQRIGMALLPGVKLR